MNADERSKKIADAESEKIKATKARLHFGAAVSAT
jgi:hypothetical protein